MPSHKRTIRRTEANRAKVAGSRTPPLPHHTACGSDGASVAPRPVLQLLVAPLVGSFSATPARRFLTSAGISVATFMTSGFYTGVLNLIRTVPMRSTHERRRELGNHVAVAADARRAQRR
jgi:hypothetical protein